MSCLRSLSGGIVMANSLRRKKRSRRKAPAAAVVSRSAFVAATRRMSTLTGLVPPTRTTLLSWSARSSLAWDPGGMLEISSRNRVPPEAVSNFPGFCRSAPVNAPFSWPNSSLSKSVSGIAPQSTATNGAEARGLAWWIARATSSLPVPVSPVTSTVKSDGATRATSALIRAIISLGPIRSGREPASRTRSDRTRIVRRSPRSVMARRIDRMTSAFSNGFTR